MIFFEMMFYAESEGLLPTRAGKLNAVIKEIKNISDSSIDLDTFKYILKKHGLSYETLSAKEMNYITSLIK